MKLLLMFRARDNIVPKERNYKSSKINHPIGLTYNFRSNWEKTLDKNRKKSHSLGRDCH